MALRDKGLVLLAEDDGPLRTLLAGALRADGYRVFEADNGGAALEQWAAVRATRPLPVLIVTDDSIPACSGREVIAALRASGCKTPMMLITAFASERLLDEAAAAGASVVMSKPFEMADFRIVVAGLVASAKDAQEEAEDEEEALRPRRGQYAPRSK
jgi:CheY-like chemotaxis protein